MPSTVHNVQSFRNSPTLSSNTNKMTHSLQNQIKSNIAESTPSNTLDLSSTDEETEEISSITSLTGSENSNPPKSDSIPKTLTKTNDIDVPSIAREVIDALKNQHDKNSEQINEFSG